MAVACSDERSEERGNSSATRWYVVRVKAHKEDYVQTQLAHAGGIETYSPVMKTPRKYLRHRQRQFEPVFPGYVFVRLDPQTQILHLRRLHGYNALVQFGGRPASVPDEFVRDFRRKEAGRSYIVHRPQRTLVSDDELRVVEGPFRGQTGRFLNYQESTDRVAMLLEFMNRRTVLNVAACSVERAPATLNTAGQPRRS
jgi:transcriptional antiterminator RfaH